MRALVLAAALAFLPTISLAQDTQSAPAAAPAAVDRTAPFARFMGEWRAHDLKGAPGNARVTWSRGVGPHLLRVDTYLAEPGKPERKIYDGFLYWHPGRQAYVLHEFAAWGSVYEGIVQVDEKGMSYDWASFEADGVKHYRQGVTWIDADSYTWKVELETPAGWTVQHEGLWRRTRSVE